MHMATDKKIPLLCRLGLHSREWSIFGVWQWSCRRCPKFQFIGRDG